MFSKSKKMKTKGIKRDLAEKVRKQVREKLVRSEVRDPNACEEALISFQDDVSKEVSNPAHEY